MKQKIKKTKKKNKEEEYLDGWQRCQAEFENYKKRQEESQKNFRKYAKEDMVMQLLPILDNFHASTDHIPRDQKNDGWVQGIMHIQKQMEDVLVENGVEEMKVKIGDNFNPELHEAVDGSKGKDKIKKIIQRGYKLNGKVVRPVKVMV